MILSDPRGSFLQGMLTTFDCKVLKLECVEFLQGSPSMDLILSEEPSMEDHNVPLEVLVV